MMVKNEDRFIYYAVKSVLPYVSRILIQDTGSTDHTEQIIRTFSNSKITFLQEFITKKEDIARVRQSQLDKTMTDWIWIVDGDEIYPGKLCCEILEIVAKGENLEGIAVGRYDLLGDIYHCQSETVGTYNLFGRKGHHVLRLINRRNIPGLKVSGIYPYEGYYDSHNEELIHHDPESFKFTVNKLWHAMYLIRSSQGGILKNTYHRDKYKIEKGLTIRQDIELPEVLFAQKPGMVEDVTGRRSAGYELLATLLTPIKKLKRRINL